MIVQCTEVMIMQIPAGGLFTNFMPENQNYLPEKLNIDIYYISDFIQP